MGPWVAGLSLAHTARLQRLPAHHSDPFDRMLVPQALTARAVVVSHDHALEPYGAPMLWT